VHKVTKVREPATAVARQDEAAERRQADHAVGISAPGLAVTGLFELAVAIVTGSVALTGDALHNLSDVST
jgi:divalent metal cation (Fe/Co/Zn/Cd) transporter